jgi:hypothetical protein
MQTHKCGQNFAANARAGQAAGNMPNFAQVMRFSTEAKTCASVWKPADISE